ncbi:hypothetical protein MUP35_04025 [Patescibacteria group bacterium]|nr:hypothetical protein [Patescibacteria group bacterium]
MSTRGDEVRRAEVLAPENATVIATASEFITIGKIPGDVLEMAVTGQSTIGQLFKKLGRDVGKCEIQKNGVKAKLTDIVKPGDTILAITKIRGN